MNISAFFPAIKQGGYSFTIAMVYAITRASNAIPEFRYRIRDDQVVEHEKALCIDAGKLTTARPYRWSRNPQYVGWFLFLLVYALTDWSLWCLVALLASAISLHLLVLVEEEHLARTFGQPYTEFCCQVPHYAGRGQLAA